MTTFLSCLASIQRVRWGRGGITCTLKKANLIKNSYEKYLNGEFETLEKAYPSWQSTQVQFIKLQLTINYTSIYKVCLTLAIFPNGAYMHS